ncbi:hypothetical protein BR93DRAFT_930267 [Coniochaeta sp. PMI_546]|nr:hypothetical protein BR93DRAFT_930267 [Coniochaeta sp. PMI_546]
MRTIFATGALLLPLLPRFREGASPSGNYFTLLHSSFSHLQNTSSFSLFTSVPSPGSGLTTDRQVARKLVLSI